MFSSFIYVVACISTSFLFYDNNIPLFGYTTSCLSFISCWTFGCFHYLAIKNNATRFVQDGKVEGRVLTPSCEGMGITTNC